jgi:hypothetical protein
MAVARGPQVADHEGFPIGGEKKEGGFFFANFCMILRIEKFKS